MKPENARKLLQEAVAKVNWINFARTLESLTEHDWGKYNNNFWRPDFNQVLFDKDWLADNAGKIKEALDTLYESRNDGKTKSDTSG